MRLIREAASIVVIATTLICYGVLWAEEDDTQIIRQFMNLGWERTLLVPTGARQPMLDWARWCKAGLQLGAFRDCPPR